MESPPEPAGLDLTRARAVAEEAARHWRLTLEPPFTKAAVSYVAPAADTVVKVAWEGDDESLHEPDALELWDGDGAVRLISRYGSAVLEQRAIPGTALALLPEREATAVAVELATRLWRPAQPPFRSVIPAVEGWLALARRQGSELAPLAAQLLAELKPSADWVVHGDFHHHNIVRHGDGYVAIDPKPYLADREYDVPAFLWNPVGNRFDDAEMLERRIAAFTAVGLSDLRIRAWTVIRGAYLRPALAKPIRALAARYL